MKIDLNASIQTENGENAVIEGKSITLARSLATVILASGEKKDPLRWYEWAMKLKDDGILDLVSSDKDELYRWVEESPLTVLVKGQILQIIKKSE